MTKVYYFICTSKSNLKWEKKQPSEEAKRNFTNGVGLLSKLKI